MMVTLIVSQKQLSDLTTQIRGNPSDDQQIQKKFLENSLKGLQRRTNHHSTLPIWTVTVTFEFVQNLSMDLKGKTLRRHASSCRERGSTGLDEVAEGKFLVEPTSQ